VPVRTRPTGRRRARLALASLAAAALLLAAAGPAAADTASITVTTSDGVADAAAYLPRIFTFSGTTTGTEHLYIKDRASGGAPCAPTAFSDPGTWIDSSFYGQAVTGSWNVQRVLTWRVPGSWMFCFWMAADDKTVVTPLSQTISFRPSAGSIAATLTPAMPRPGQQAQVTVAGTTEAPKRVYAKLRPADGIPCAASYDTDAGGSLLDGWSVDGGPFSITETYTQRTPGQYYVCLWLAGSSDDTLPIGGPQQQVFSIVQPPKPALASVVAINCKTKRTVKRFRARTVKSVCMRYRFSRPPESGQRISVSFVTPRHVTYRTYTTTWPAVPPATLTTHSLPSGAYKHRRGTWSAVLRVDGAWVKTKTFHVVR
jgi:hypothetical protein